MQGATLKAEREYDLLISQAWHEAKFNALAQVGKLKGLKSYIGKKAVGGKRSKAADAVAFFHALKAAGVAVSITRSARKPAE